MSERENKLKHIVNKILPYRQALIRRGTGTVLYEIPAKITDMNPETGDGHLSAVFGSAAETGLLSLFFTGSKNKHVERYGPLVTQLLYNEVREALQGIGLKDGVFDWGDVPLYGMGGVLFIATDVASQKLIAKRKKKKQVSISTQ